MKNFLAVFLIILAPGSIPGSQKDPVIYTIPLPPKADFSTIQWLVGDWSGKTTDSKEAGDVHLSVAYALSGRFLQIQGDVSLPPTKTAPATHESWSGMLSQGPAPGTFTIHLFTSNGFMTRYQVTVADNQVFFNPEGGPLPPQGWLFRWIFAQTGPDECTQTVAVAPPEKSFFHYYSAKLSRHPPVTPIGTPSAGASAPK